MSNKVEGKKMNPAVKRALVPRLRFPEFRDAGEWEDTPLKAIAKPVSERAAQGEENNVLSLSAEHGIVLQSEFFGRKVAGENSERYLKITRNDFVYNDRTTKTSTYGTIKRLSKYTGGIVSPIYKCFRFNADENPVFWEWYFESGIHDQQLSSLVNEGARTGRFNISIGQFLSTAAWRPDEAEQHKIADCLSSIDELVTLEAQKLDMLQEAHKKWLMQQLFPAEGETLPRLRFPEFWDAGEWSINPLGNVAENLDSRRVPITENDRAKGDVPYYGASGVIDCVKDHIFDEELLCVSEDGANLIARAYPIAFSISGKTWVNNHAHVLKLKSGFTQVIVENYLNSISLEDFLTGMAQPKLNRAKLDIIPIPLPQVAGEQQKIADCLSSIDELITAQTKRLATIKAHKKGLMQQLFPALDKVRE